MGEWKALKEQECGDVVLGQIGRTLKNIRGCLDFILRAMETDEGPEA